MCVGLGTLAILYTTFLFNRLDKSLDDKFKPIKELLSNHITETNKKIDSLNERFDKQDDRLLNQFNTQNKQVTDLYSVLLKSIQDSKQNK